MTAVFALCGSAVRTPVLIVFTWRLCYCPLLSLSHTHTHTHTHTYTHTVVAAPLHHARVLPWVTMWWTCLFWRQKASSQVCHAGSVCLRTTWLLLTHNLVAAYTQPGCCLHTTWLLLTHNLVAAQYLTIIHTYQIGICCPLRVCLGRTVCTN
jgi:hypothetical protein